MPFSFLFNTERLNGWFNYEVEDNGLGMQEMINMLVAKTMEIARRTGWKN